MMSKKKLFKEGGLPFLIGFVGLFFYAVGTFEPEPGQNSLNHFVPVFAITSIAVGLLRAMKREKKHKKNVNRKKYK